MLLLLLIRIVNYKINCENPHHHELLSNINYKFLLVRLMFVQVFVFFSYLML